MFKDSIKAKKKYITVKQPEIVHLYNNGMGGVDLLDQLISYYRIFFIAHFIDFAVVSSWIEYKETQLRNGIPKKDIIDLLNF